MQPHTFSSLIAPQQSLEKRSNYQAISNYCALSINCQSWTGEPLVFSLLMFSTSLVQLIRLLMSVQGFVLSVAECLTNHLQFCFVATTFSSNCGTALRRRIISTWCRFQSPTFVTHICHPHLSPTFVTHICHPHLSPTFVTHIFHPHLSPTFVWMIIL